MNRLTLGFAVALGLAVATVIGLWSTGSASAGNPNAGLKCYRTVDVHSKLPNNQLIYISDQFEAKNLIVKKPISFCAFAVKSESGSSAGFADLTHILCYAIKDAPGQQRFQPQEVLVQDQFDANFVRLTKPYSLCEPADKQVTTDSQQAGGGEFFQDFSFKCYQLRRLEHSRGSEKIELNLLDQFDGEKEARLGRPVAFCTQVEEKKNKAKNDRIDRAVTLNGPEDEHHASTIGASSDRSDPEISCADSYGHSVWYTYTTGSFVEKVTIRTTDSTYDTVLAVFGAQQYGIDPDEEIACNDDKNFPTSGHSSVELKLDPYSTYYIVVGAFGGDQAGKLKLKFEVVGECSSCEGGAAVSPAGTSGVGEAAGADWNLMCYALSQRAPENVLVLTNDQLNAHQFEVGRGIMYCTPAAKCKFVTKNGAGDAVLAGAEPYLCNQ